MKLVISIPVHEKLEVVLDQIRNIRFYVPSATIILHVSQTFCWRDNNPAREEVFDVEGVIVNPEKLPTVYGKGMLVDVHNLNFKYALKNLDFDYFAMHASNDLFFSKGVENYMTGHDAGLHQMYTAPNMDWMQRDGAEKDNDLARLMEHLGIQKITGSVIEGTFYKKEIFSEMVNIIEKFYRYTNEGSPNYAKEEIYYPTIAAKFAKDIVTPYTYFYYDGPVNKEVVDGLRRKEQLEEDYQVMAGKEFRRYDMKNLYNIKNIIRIYHDPIRTYMRELLESDIAAENKSTI